MTEQLLEIDVRLLVLRYGKEKVLHVLAQLGDQTLEEIEQNLRSIERNPKTNRITRSKPSLTDVVNSEFRDRPEIAELLRVIAVNYENRVFLPHLRDVQRFLDRFGASHGKLKSRAGAGSVLVRALSKLPREELLTLATREGLSRESDYSLLSRAIMGTPERA